MREPEASQHTGARPEGSSVRLSVVIPAFHCADTIQSDVRQLEATLSRAEPSYEIVVVVDGEDGGTREAAAAIQSDRLVGL